MYLSNRKHFSNLLCVTDIAFFIDKDYSTDVSSVGGSDKIMESINRLREPIRNMGADNQAKVIKSIQNLTKLADMCV